MHRQPLGKLLISRGIIAVGQLERALDEQRKSNRQSLLGEILVRQQLCSQEQVTEALAAADEIPFARVGPHLADPKVVALLPYELLRRKNVLPLFLVEGVLTVAMAEPFNIFLAEELEHRSGHGIQVVAATARDIQATLDAYLPGEQAFIDVGVPAPAVSIKLHPSVSTDNAHRRIIAPEPGALRIVESCIASAIVQRAAEIHLEPTESDLRVRFRIDGRLVEHLRPPQRLAPAIIAFLKQLAGMDAGQNSLPQKGRLRAELNGQSHTFAASCVPTRNGQRLILRKAADDGSPLKLEKLGFSYDALKQWRKILACRSGLVVVAGPSGSGKREVLYSAIQERATPDTNLCSVEDPIERAIVGATQIQVDSSAGLEFSAAAQAALWQEPDILMLSDLPDGQTAGLAARAALGGKLVLAAMHAPDAASAAWRLTRMGVDPNLLASTLIGVLARRLVRRLCTHCRQTVDATAAQRRLFANTITGPLILYQPRGCEHCNNTGYDGRIGVNELLVLDDALRERLSQNVPLPELRETIAQHGLKPLRLDGLEKARNGLTTLEEVLRAC